MAKRGKVTVKAANKVVVRSDKAPCGQGFNLSNPKPGKKVRTWWNGYRKAPTQAEA